ncbi:MAG TPA: DNRLRE domain-containing protein, partial [Candidatus Limnocylindrales bacterium]
MKGLWALAVVGGVALLGVPAASAVTFTVTTTADAGSGSLRQAILDANGAPGVDTIVFAIPGAGEQVIQPATALPVVTDAVVIDGGAQVDGSGLPLVRIDGGADAAPSLYGLELDVASVGTSTVNKLAFTRWDSDTGAGLFVHGIGTALLTGNLVGTDAAGSAGLGNDSGVIVENATLIGGATAGQANVISGNLGAGIRMLAPVTDTAVIGNRIGTSPFGDDLGNGGAGISIEGAFDNVIGGTTTVDDGNVIAFNAKGVVVTSGTGNAIVANDIFSNDGLGIDLGDDGVTANDEVTAYDSDTGANNLQNFPLLTTAEVTPGLMTVSGEIFSSQGTTLSVEIFSSDACDGSGFGEGGFYHGRLDVLTNSDGFAQFSPSFGFAGAVGRAVTATATGPGGTSEFSACVTSTGSQSQPAQTFMVTTGSDTPADAGCTVADCTLREAITAANSSLNDPETVDRIEFAIPGVGVQTILPATELPAITDPVVIDGTTQPGFATAPLIFVDGTDASCGECGIDGLTVSSAGGGSTIRGLAIGDFDGWGIVFSEGSGSVVEESWVGLAPPLAAAAGNLSGGIQISNSSGNLIGGTEPAQRVYLGSNGAFGAQIAISGLASGNKVEGSYIGIGPDGGATFNTPSGVRISGGASGNTIGGSSDEARGNLISGFSGVGVVLDSAGSGNVIAGNAIGIDGAEGAAPPIGVSVVDSPATVVGDDVSPPGFANPGFGNVIGGAATAGISITGSSTGTKVTGNFVGTDRTGLIQVGNATGIHVFAVNNTIGPGNTVAYNAANGVEIVGEFSDGNRIVANSIFENGGLGIDLQSFSNNDLDAPTLATAETIGATTTVEGTMSGTDGTYFVEFFTNVACDGATGGEGRTYVGFATVVVAGETGSFTGTLPALPAGTVLTGTVTSGATNDTSEFSACATVTAATGETVVTLVPEADTYVDGAATTTNFGSADHFDTYGGFSSNCVPHTAPAYGLLRFDVSGLPSGEIVDARLVLTSRAGFAQDGDPNHHAIFLSDDAWDESAVTWSNKPSDGTVAAGDPTLVGGGDIRVSDGALGADFVWRGTCNADFAGDQTKVFPTNSDTVKTLAAAREDMIATVGAERDGDGRLSLELYNPNCVSCPGGANLGYWARYYSREAADAALRPKLVVTFAESLSVTSFTAAPADPIAGVPEVRLADVPPSVLLQPSSTASTPLADTPLADTPLADTPLADTPLADTPLGDTPLADTSLGLGDLLTELRTVPLSSLPLLREGGWPAVLDGTPLAFRALQNVTLGEVLALTPPPLELDRQGDDDIRLEELDFTRSPLGDVAAIAFALGNGVTLSELSGALTDGKLDPALELWCAVTNTSCPTTSILALGLRGAPLADTPLADTPLADTPLADTPLGDTPLADTPLADTPLADTPLGDTPLADTDLSRAPLGDTPLADTPLADTDLNGAPLADTPLADTPLADTPLADTPLADTLISDLASCTALFAQCPAPNDTIGQHYGELLPGVTIADLLAALTPAALSSLTLGDLVASLPQGSAYTVDRMLAMLEPPSEYTLAQVAAIFTAASGVTLADLVASLPTPNDFTLNDLLLAVLRAGAQWERLDVTQPALARVAIGGGVVNLNANLSVAGPASVLTFAAELPRGWTSIDPSGSIETVPPGAASALEIVSVEPIAGGGSRHT